MFRSDPVLKPGTPRRRRLRPAFFELWAHPSPTQQCSTVVQRCAGGEGELFPPCERERATCASSLPEWSRPRVHPKCQRMPKNGRHSTTGTVCARPTPSPSLLSLQPLPSESQASSSAAAFCSCSPIIAAIAASAGYMPVQCLAKHMRVWVCKRRIHTGVRAHALSTRFVSAVCVVVQSCSTRNTRDRNTEIMKGRVLMSVPRRMAN